MLHLQSVAHGHGPQHRMGPNHELAAVCEGLRHLQRQRYGPHVVGKQQCQRCGNKWLQGDKDERV